MAFRIDEHVIRGEVDNRVRGQVQGIIWLHGREEPLVLHLTGNASPDIAGCLLTFSNPKPGGAANQIQGLANVQHGEVGQLSASRKVRVFDVPLIEAMAMLRRKEKPPEHLANSLYLEWFSATNGRVVIESADFHLNLSPPEWRLTSP